LKNPIYKYSQSKVQKAQKIKNEYLEQLRIQDPFCKGVVLDIDSGGGHIWNA
jgi:protease-4